MESGNRRLTLLEQLSAVDNGRDTLAGLTLAAILGNGKRPEQLPTQNRTLLEIIRDDGSNKEKNSWKTLRDKLRLKRAVSAWTSSVHVPDSDFNVNGNRSRSLRRGSFCSNSADSTRVEDGSDRAPVYDPTVVNYRLQLTRRVSVRLGHNQVQTDHDDSAHFSMPGDAPPSTSFSSEVTRHHSIRSPSSNIAGNDVDSSEYEDSPMARGETRQLGAALAEERALSAREAVAAREAVEAATAAAAAAEQSASAADTSAPPPTVGASEEPVRMSLMDLLEETDRQRGLTGSRYTTGHDADEYKEKETAEASSGIEHTCCVCMVRHKGAAFIPCGHTFCRLCSRELWVQRGNCPLCNGIILEILDIF